MDIGNLYCVISAVKRGGITVILNENSKRQNLCAVSFQDKKRLLGDTAKPMLRSNYKNTITELRRLVGRSWDDPLFQRDLARRPNKDFFQQLPGSNRIGVKVQYDGTSTVFAPEQLLAMLLRHLVAHIAANDTGISEPDVVLSVPGYFTDVQRRALLSAGAVAGIPLLRLINDNTATALSYGMWKSARGVFDAEKPQYVLFVDVGHSDTACSVVSFVKGRLCVLGEAHDEDLGGRNIDHALADHFAAQFAEKHGGQDPRTNPKSLVKLLAECEKMKTSPSKFRGTPDCNETLRCTATAWMLIVAQCSAIPQQA